MPLRDDLPNGGYVVRWHEVDEDDGHLVSGAFPFAVGRGSRVPLIATGGGHFSGWTRSVVGFCS